MVIYYCNVCRYETKNLSHYNKHIKSKKHIANIKTFENPIRTHKNHIESYKFKCPNCNNLYSTNSHMNRHIKKCKLNNHNINQELLELKLENQKLNYENKIVKLESEIKIKETENKLKDTIIKEKDKSNGCINSNNNIINSNNNITNNNNINTNITVNVLNQNYSHVISIDDFKKLVDHNKIPKDIVEMIESAFNNDTLQAKSQSLIVYMKNVCKQNDLDMLPFICNDSNIRSHKEKTKDGWKVVINNDNIIYLIDSTFRNIAIQYPEKTIIAEPQLRLEDLPKSIKKNLSSIKEIKVINDNEEQIEDKMIRFKYYMETLLKMLMDKNETDLYILLSKIYYSKFINIKSLYKSNDDILTNEEMKEILYHLSIQDIDNITIHQIANIFNYQN